MTDAGKRKQLATELTTDPLARGYSGMTHEQRLASLRTKDRTINAPRAITPQLVLEVFGATEATAIMEAIDTAVNGSDDDIKSALKWAMQIMYPNRGGIPADAPDVDTQLALLVSKSILTSDQLGQLQAAMTRTVDRLTELGIGDVHLGDVIEASKEID